MVWHVTHDNVSIVVDMDDEEFEETNIIIRNGFTYDHKLIIFVRLLYV